MKYLLKPVFTLQKARKNTQDNCIRGNEKKHSTHTA